MSSAVQFVFSHEGSVLARFALDAGEYVIGSEETCQVVIELDGMAPRHARLHVGADGVRVEDLSGESGTFVAGTRLSEAIRLKGDAPVTFGSCVGELRMESPVRPARSLRAPRRKRKPRRLAPEDPGWEIWTQPAAPVQEAAPAGELQRQLETQTEELRQLREENAALVEADRLAHQSVQDNMSLLKVANRALLKKLSAATAPSDERETLRRELKQREKALVEAWAGRQAADERNSHLARQVSELEAGRGEAPATALVALPGWLFWGLLGGIFGMALLGYLLKNSVDRARGAEAVVAKVRATAPQFYGDSRALVNEGEFQQALGKIDCALALDPTLPDYFFQRGSICESLLLIDPAIAAFESVINLRPGDRAGQKNLDLCRSIKLPGAARNRRKANMRFTNSCSRRDGCRKLCACPAPAG